MDCLTVPGAGQQPQRKSKRMSVRQNSLPARPSRGTSPTSASRSHSSLRGGSFHKPRKQGELILTVGEMRYIIVIFRSLSFPGQCNCSLKTHSIISSKHLNIKTVTKYTENIKFYRINKLNNHNNNKMQIFPCIIFARTCFCFSNMCCNLFLNQEIRPSSQQFL